MAHFWFILLFVALALPRGGGAFSIKGLGFLGFPLGEPYHSADGQGWHGCISEQEAEIFVRRFISILNRGTSDLGNATETAEDIIAEGFTVISNSILSLEGTLLTSSDGIDKHSKEEWIEGILHAPSYGGIRTLKVVTFCDLVLWYWEFSKIGTGQYPNRGFNLFKMVRVPSRATVQAEMMYIEFDSLAWALDTGFQCQFRNGTQIPTKPLPPGYGE